MKNIFILFTSSLFFIFSCKTRYISKDSSSDDAIKNPDVILESDVEEDIAFEKKDALKLTVDSIATPPSFYLTKDEKKFSSLFVEINLKEGSVNPDYFKLCVKSSGECVYENNNLLVPYEEIFGLEEGTYQIEVTPCVDEKNSLDPKKLCGTKSTIFVRQEKNPEELDIDLFKELQSSQKRLDDLAGEFQKTSESCVDLFKNIPKDDENYDDALKLANLIEEQKKIGPSAFKLVFNSPDFKMQLTEELTQENEEDKSAEENQVESFGLTKDVPITGCMDNVACNYNSSATEDDLSCNYPSSCMTCEGKKMKNLEGIVKTKDVCPNYEKCWEFSIPGRSQICDKENDSCIDYSLYKSGSCTGEQKYESIAWGSTIKDDKCEWEERNSDVSLSFSYFNPDDEEGDCNPDYPIKSCFPKLRKRLENGHGVQNCDKTIDEVIGEFYTASCVSEQKGDESVSRCSYSIKDHQHECLLHKTCYKEGPSNDECVQSANDDKTYTYKCKSKPFECRYAGDKCPEFFDYKKSGCKNGKCVYEKTHDPCETRDKCPLEKKWRIGESRVEAWRNFYIIFSSVAVVATIQYNISKSNDRQPILPAPDSEPPVVRAVTPVPRNVESPAKRVLTAINSQVESVKNSTKAINSQVESVKNSTKGRRTSLTFASVSALLVAGFATYNETDGFSIFSLSSELSSPEACLSSMGQIFKNWADLSSEKSKKELELMESFSVP